MRSARVITTSRHRRARALARSLHRKLAWLLRASLLCALLLAPALASAEGDLFTRVTEGPLVNTPGFYWGGSWGDYDDDGWLDVFVGSQYSSTTNHLYRNDRSGGFSLIDPAAMPKSPSNQHGSAWADYDNDGHLDLIVTAGNPEQASNMLYRNNGDGTFTGITSDAIYNDYYYAGAGVHAPKWGDYDNDGLVDLFIAGHNIVNRLFHNDGAGVFTRLDPHVLVNDPGNSEGGAWTDYDNDGDIDLFVTNASTYRNRLYRNDQSAGFRKVTDSGLTPSLEPRIGACFADYDNDGLLDVFLGSAFSGDTSLYHNDGNGKFSAVLGSPVTAPLPPGHAAFNCAWGDYDNDGFLDLVKSTGIFGAPIITTHNQLYHNAGDGTFTEVTEGSLVTDPTTSFTSWVDYDNDGFLDYFGARGAFRPAPLVNLLYHNNGNNNAWLNVKLVGSVSNRSAIGAKVRVNATYRDASRWQLREISGGDGQSHQQSLNAEFGLADAEIIDTVRVEWPSGVVQELHNVAPRQFLKITEPLPVGIDIKPANGTNLIQPFSRLLIPVALLGSARLDVRDVDLASLGFGPERAPSVRAEGWPSDEDVNGDGLLDLVTAYRTSATGIAPGDTQACLSGELEDGTPFEGCDAITTVTGCGIGFELVFVLLPVWWLVQRRRARLLRLRGARSA